MSDFVRQILIIVIAGVAIGVLAAVWGFLANKNVKNRTPEEVEHVREACASCSMASMCANFGQKSKCEKDAQSEN